VPLHDSSDPAFHRSPMVALLTAPGANPMLSVMSLAHRTAANISAITPP